MADIFGNAFSLNLARGLAILAGEYDPLLGNSLSAPCDCEPFHDFRVLAGNGTARLWIDGFDQGSVTLLLSASSLSPYTDGVWFGDGTNFAGNRSQVEFISASTVVPEPSSLSLMALVGVGALVVRKRLV